MPNFTRIAIKQAFIRLLGEKPLSKITVQDIVDECGVNRNSFYYHFQDIPALTEEIIIEQTDRLIAEYPTISGLEDGLNAAVDFAKKNQKIIYNIYRSSNRDLFEQRLWSICEYAVRAYGDRAFGEEAVSKEDHELFVEYYKCVSYGIVMDWMEHGMEGDVHTMIHRFLKLNNGMVEDALKRARE